MTLLKLIKRNGVAIKFIWQFKPVQEQIQKGSESQGLPCEGTHGMCTMQVSPCYDPPWEQVNTNLVQATQSQVRRDDASMSEVTIFVSSLRSSDLTGV